MFGMLRSEVCWFPRFIQICRLAFRFMNELDRNGLQDVDYDVMRRVIWFQGKQEVWSILHAYNDAVFRSRIWAYEELAQGLVSDRS